ncbi:AraC family transcriptional regulator, partial [Mycolicibacterium fortuitum]|uniref:helix-turn-helix transcriptional regulator n=1 Tax=Mycolicibacterium fortuitum TaxID=1766 RepID=UPI0007ED4488
VEGDTAEYCEIAIPDQLLGETTLIPRIKYRDPLMHHLVEEIYSVADRDDAIARLLTDSVAETMRLLIRDKYAEAPPKSREHRTFDTRTRTMLVDYLNDSLDSDIHLDAPTRSKIIEFLEDGMDSEITLEMLAQQAKMSVGGFIKAFRAAFHTTPYQYLLDRRIERAKSLLLDTTRTVTEISAMVGFSTPNHFATAFRRRVGTSPRNFRDCR